MERRHSAQASACGMRFKSLLLELLIGFKLIKSVSVLAFSQINGLFLDITELILTPSVSLSGSCCYQNCVCDRAAEGRICSGTLQF